MSPTSGIGSSMALVLDVSIVAKWFLPDERSGFAQSLLDAVVVEGAFVPALFRWEIENVLLGAERAGRIEPNDVDDALDLLRDLPIFIEPPGERVFAGNEVPLARYYDLTPYDAAYLSLAANQKIPLATTDNALAYAARDLGIVVCTEPSNGSESPNK
jgi:predicted nucleic acid-binding protein